MLPILGLLVGDGVHRTIARTKRSGIFIAAATLFFLTAYVLAVTAVAIWLEGIYGAMGAILFLAACFLLIGVVVLIVMAIINAREARRAQERRRAIESMAAIGIGLVRSQPLLTAGVLTALIASTLLGSKRGD
jgi:phosphoglycerol transferase MdoB-like AlkP superfamily enzyme